MTQVKRWQNFSGDAALTAARPVNPAAFATALAGNCIQLIPIIAGRVLLHQHRELVVAGSTLRDAPRRSNY